MEDSTHATIIAVKAHKQPHRPYAGPVEVDLRMRHSPFDPARPFDTLDNP